MTQQTDKRKQAIEALAEARAFRTGSMGRYMRYDYVIKNMQKAAREDIEYLEKQGFTIVPKDQTT